MQHTAWNREYACHAAFACKAARQYPEMVYSVEALFAIRPVWLEAAEMGKAGAKGNL